MLPSWPVLSWKRDLNRNKYFTWLNKEKKWLQHKDKPMMPADTKYTQFVKQASIACINTDFPGGEKDVWRLRCSYSNTNCLYFQVITLLLLSMTLLNSNKKKKKTVLPHRVHARQERTGSRLSKLFTRFSLHCWGHNEPRKGQNWHKGCLGVWL